MNLLIFLARFALNAECKAIWDSMPRQRQVLAANGLGLMVVAVVIGVLGLWNPWLLLLAFPMLLYGSYQSCWYSQYRDHYYEQ